MKKLLLIPVLFAALTVSGQKKSQPKGPEGYIFTDVISLPATPVKDQSRSGTCWSFAGNAVLESELLRDGKGEVDLAEMWIVRWCYYDKAVRYFRMHGETNFAAGGAFHDITHVVRKYGIVPEEVYPGLKYGTDNHNHAELDLVLEGYIKAVLKGKKPTPAWRDGLNGILDAYFGPVPEKFTYQGREFTPKSYARYLGLDPDDFISVTSFTHEPFYTSFILEIPDNWLWETAYNVPIDELERIMEYALENGYTIGWGADVSEKGFAWRNGLAVVPEADVQSMGGTEQARWVALSAAEREAELYKFDRPGKEKKITQEMRQEAFDNFETTDDHGMQITGTAVDQDGNKYYRVKNSWGATSNPYNGYFYASYPFVNYKTISIWINKNALPADIKAKLGL